MVKDLVSILMPVYNGQDFLDRSISSVLKQDYSKWELIIVDDASKDNSIAVIEKYLPDKRIKLIKNEDNKGIATSRNIGLEFSQGEYITLLDQDDEWLDHKLSKQVSLFKQLPEEYGLVYCNTKVVREEGKDIEKKLRIEPKKTIPENLKKLFFSNFVSSLTVMLRKDYLDNVGFFDENIKWGGDDYDLWLRFAERYKFGFVDEVLAIRHEHGKNFSATKKNIMHGTIELAKYYANKHPFLKKELNKTIAINYYRYGVESIKQRKLLRGLEYVLKSFLYSRIGLFRMFESLSRKLTPSKKN